jgi:regulator of protease activity HflC (stomatin/prohibitin superfamily)
MKYVAWTLLAVFICFGLMVGFPIYSVWSKGMSGKAELAEADWNRQIAIREAEALKESSVFRAQADSIRAEGTAIANRIIAESISEEYLRWMWIDQVGDATDQIIYVPTEASLPILEANRD